MNLLTAAGRACILGRNRARVPAKKRSRTLALFIFKAMRKKSTPAFAHTESGRMVRIPLASRANEPFRAQTERAGK